MRKKVVVLFLISFALCLLSCGQDNERLGNLFSSKQSQILHAPYDASSLEGMYFADVESSFLDAGFEAIAFSQVDDIDSNSNIADGTVIDVSINGITDYTTSTEFNKSDEVVITYHNIPKIAVPISPIDARSKHYMDVGKLFFDAGFENIETDEVYDLSADSISETIISANGKILSNEEQIPFDSRISVIQHFPISEYPVTIKIDFDSNWIFNKYGVDVTLDGASLGTLDHGEDAVFEEKLPAGSYDINFTKQKEENVSGQAAFMVTSKTTATFRISCHSDHVDVKRTEFSQAKTENNLLLPFSSYHYLRKDYQPMLNELKQLGFKNVTAEPTTDVFWMPDKVNSVVRVEIDGKTSFDHDDIFDKSAPVTLFYHIADFAFNESKVSVTEKDTFELPYTLTSGDSIDSILFEIDNSKVLKRNEDGTYTALSPGTATVTASGDGNIYSKCTVEVSEILVPIEKIEFSDAEMNVAVGSTFDLKYTVFPENTNYNEMQLVISNDLIEQTGENTFYSNEAGDTDISYYQDGRLLGTCKIHSTLIDIDDIVFDELGEAFINKPIDLGFKLSPANATLKGIHATSSDSEIVDVAFNERGKPVLTITGKSAGEAIITLIVPNGTEYTHNITIKEIDPVEIKLSNASSNQRIEVGSTIRLEAVWQPQDTTVQELTWTSNNPNVIRVVEDGTLEAVGVGTAEIVAAHKTGLTSSISLTVEPTLVTKVEISSDKDDSKKFYPGDKFTISASITPENATNKQVEYSSSDESVAKVNDNGVVTAVSAGTATVTVLSPDGPKKTLSVKVDPPPQKFKISWSASLIENNHVGNSWSKEFEVNGEPFSNGSTITLDPESSFSVCFYATEYDDNPDVGDYYKEIEYSDELCRNGYTISTEVDVVENSGRYAHYYAVWSLKINIVPVR